jgi:hypothetical protein
MSYVALPMTINSLLVSKIRCKILHWLVSSSAGEWVGVMFPASALHLQSKHCRLGQAFLAHWLVSSSAGEWVGSMFPASALHLQSKHCRLGQAFLAHKCCFDPLLWMCLCNGAF